MLHPQDAVVSSNQEKADYHEHDARNNYQVQQVSNADEAHGSDQQITGRSTTGPHKGRQQSRVERTGS